MKKRLITHLAIAAFTGLFWGFIAYRFCLWAGLDARTAWVSGGLALAGTGVLMFGYLCACVVGRLE